MYFAKQHTIFASFFIAVSQAIVCCEMKNYNMNTNALSVVFHFFCAQLDCEACLHAQVETQSCSREATDLTMSIFDFPLSTFWSTRRTHTGKQWRLCIHNRYHERRSDSVDCHQTVFVSRCARYLTLHAFGLTKITLFLRLGVFCLFHTLGVTTMACHAKPKRSNLFDLLIRRN